ncbi:MAG: xanthine dehydrogenase family protein [Alphaproteobacteria bacterium]|nr:xanthine dehydrogenase family protein [Alphaproteobacteria bacterium]MCW5738988.1 xanthine dehydrogenase family protein [Alphaproteobacteria bacterium]
MVTSVRHVGAALRRIEDPRLLSGRGYYAADLAAPGMLVAAVLRSPLPHARVGAIDTTKATALPGVALVATAADLGAAQRALPSFGQFPKSLIDRWQPTIRTCPHPTLAQDKVRYVGQPVALVVAESREIAEDALELIEVDYQPLPVTTTIEQSLAADAPRLFEDQPGNVALEFRTTIGDIEAAFASAAHVVRDRFAIQRYSGMALEGRGLLAVPAQDGLTVWASHQLPHFLRGLICESLALPHYAVRVLQPDIGGGFGQKAGMYSEDVLVPWAAHRLGRPVKWLEDKAEQLVGSSHSRQQEFDMELALDADARVLGLRYRARIDAGGYLTFPVVLSYLGMCHMLGPYRLPAFAAHVQSVLTNKTHSAPSRGAGRPEAAFALNRIMDRAAQQIGIDPIELRRRNFIQPADMPYSPGILYRDGNPLLFESGDYPGALERALQAIDRDSFRREQAAARAEGRHLGLGIECNIEAGGLGPYEYARVRVDPSGKLVVHTGLVDSGQGHKTVFAQVCADQLGVDPADVVVLATDTDALTYGRGTYHSRGAVAGGGAVHKAASALRARLVEIAARHFQIRPDTLVVEGGAVFEPGTDRRLTFADCARLATPELALPVGGAPGLDETAVFEMPTTSWGNAVHAAFVEVDVETGRVRVLRYVVLHDCGRMINPLIVRGQVLGALVQGIGGSLLEELGYDPHGNPQATTLQEYILPRLDDVPEIEILNMETPSPLNPLGVKGAGEAGTLGPPAALAAAVEDALAPFGVRIHATPLSPRNILAALRAKREEKANAARPV